MGTESCRWDPVRAFNRMVSALLRAHSMSVRGSSPTARSTSAGQACLPTAVGIRVSLLTPPPRTHRALQIGSGGSGDLEHAPAQV